MYTKLLLVIIVSIFLLYLFLKKRLFQRLKQEWLTHRLVRSLGKLEQIKDNYNSPKSKLKRAQEAANVLRSGFWVNMLGQKIYLEKCHIDDYLFDVNRALETNFSYEQINTTKDEVIGFRNGETHKISAKLQLDVSRELEESPRDYQILELTKDANFTLEEIGTTEEELELLAREYSRRLEVSFVKRFKDWATGESDFYQESDKFEERISELISDEYYVGKFTYEEVGTSEQEYKEMMRLARRREVIRWIDYLKSSAKKGETDNSFARKMISESLKKAELTLDDFNITEFNLDQIGF